MIGLILKTLFSRLLSAATALFSFVRANPQLAAILALAGLSGALWWRLDHVMGQRDAARSEVAAMIRVGKAQGIKYRQSEQRMSESAKAIQQEKDREVADISAARDALLEQLRNRPRRPVPTAAQGAADQAAPPVGTGTGLFAEDAGFLVGEAARADRIKAELKSCYVQYDAVWLEFAQLQSAPGSAIP
jgi:hypothetical protein